MLMFNVDLILVFAIIGIAALLLFPLLRKGYGIVVGTRGPEDSMELMADFDKYYKPGRRLFFVVFIMAFIVMFGLHPIQTDTRQHPVGQVELTNEPPATKEAITASNAAIEKAPEIKMEAEAEAEEEVNMKNFDDFINKANEKLEK